MKEANQNKEGKGTLFAFYGTLRNGYGNNRLLQNEFSTYLGTQKTNPAFTMVSLGGFPGVIPGGDTAITIEVFRVESKEVEQRLNWLEGHRGKDHPSNFYNVMEIETQWGIANMYILDNAEYGKSPIVKSGDWSAHLKSKSFTK